MSQGETELDTVTRLIWLEGQKRSLEETPNYGVQAISLPQKR
jgi:hypothetical protein